MGEKGKKKRKNQKKVDYVPQLHFLQFSQTYSELENGKYE